MGSQLSDRDVRIICRQVYQRFPAVDGVRPSVQRQEAGSGERYLLVFRGRVTLGDGASMPTTVRVTADSAGRILKTTTSR